jgi:hypothetical protein
MFAKKFETKGEQKYNNYANALRGKLTIPKHSAVLYLNMDQDKLQAKCREVNKQAYKDPILGMQEEISFGIVDGATTEDLPYGDAAHAWKNLQYKYKSKSALTMVRLKKSFANNKLMTIKRQPDD